MQPYFFPYIGYWQLINAVDTYVIYDDVDYIRRGWINRNNILLNSIKHLITFSVSGVYTGIKINKVMVDENCREHEKLLKTIAYTYKKAEFFSQVFPILEKILLKKNKYICEMLIYQIIEIAKYFDIKTKFFISSQLEKNTNLKGECKIIDICKCVNSTVYINAIGGKALYTQSNFSKENLALYFLKPNTICYKQNSNEFVPNLSIIDVMMFNSPDKIREMLNAYELIQ